VFLQGVVYYDHVEGLVYLCLGHATYGVWLWPLIEVGQPDGEQSAFTLSVGAMPSMHFVTDLDDWSAVPCRVISPAVSSMQGTGSNIARRTGRSPATQSRRWRMR